MQTISIHTSAREVTIWGKGCSDESDISIHTSAREVTDVNYCYRDFPTISIHTSAREVTERDIVDMVADIISIHTSAREVTEVFLSKMIITKFQSTLPQGKWHTWLDCHRICTDFNPHFRKGSDAVVHAHIAIDIKFQSTLPQGKWQKSSWGSWASEYFNPHFRKGSDIFQSAESAVNSISIHTSAREVTGQGELQTRISLFQSTLPQGKWLSAREIFHRSWNFNPHFRKGSDSDSACAVVFAYISIHTSAREVTERYKHHLSTTVFQSTLPQGKWLQSLFLWKHFNNFNPHFRKGSDADD